MSLKNGWTAPGRETFPCASITPCGWVRNIGRDGQEKRLLTLAQLRDAEVDMFTTVFIGSTSTRQIGENLVTPRGYEGKK